MKKYTILLLAMFVISFSMMISSCYKEVIVSGKDDDDDEEIAAGTGLADWSTETHSNDVNPNYNVVFPQDKVNRLDMVISSANWAKMLSEISANSGSSTPTFVPASIFFDGKEWYKVGVRFKGNSSLRSAYSSGTMKLSFRFDFDEYEDEYPEIKNQRFYGFKKLSLSNGFQDMSLMHEKMASDIFRNAGIPSPQTAFYRIYVDYGQGAKYFGLYTMVEIVEDTMLDSQFGSNTGNCYKPEGINFTSFTSTTGYDKKTNEEEADYSDVKKMISYLNASTRTTNPTQWMSDLESVFDVDHFMKWLAVNTVIQNWDTYGISTHNFYLYNNPATSKLTWIPWDNNEALSNTKNKCLSFAMSEVNTKWPLIKYLIDTPEYKALYLKYLRETIEGAFKPVDIKVKYQYFYDLIQPYVTGANGEVSGYTFLTSSSAFSTALTTQKNQVDSRFSATTSYLATQK